MKKVLTRLSESYYCDLSLLSGIFKNGKNKYEILLGESGKRVIQDFSFNQMLEILKIANAKLSNSFFKKEFSRASSVKRERKGSRKAR